MAAVSSARLTFTIHEPALGRLVPNSRNQVSALRLPAWVHISLPLVLPAPCTFSTRLSRRGNITAN